MENYMNLFKHVEIEKVIGRNSKSVSVKDLADFQMFLKFSSFKNTTNFSIQTYYLAEKSGQHPVLKNWIYFIQKNW